MDGVYNCLKYMWKIQRLRIIIQWQMVTGLLGFVTNRTQFRFFKNKGQYKEDQLNARILTDIVVNDYRIYFSGF